MAISPENTARLALINRKVIAGDATLDELREGVAILRSDRVAGSIASTKSRTKAAEDKKVIDPAAMLAGLRALGGKLEGQVMLPGK